MSDRKLEEIAYEEIRKRFYSKYSCGPDRRDQWWDWLAVWLPAQFAQARREGAEEADARWLTEEPCPECGCGPRTGCYGCETKALRQEIERLRAAATRANRRDRVGRA